MKFEEIIEKITKSVEQFNGVKEDEYQILQWIDISDDFVNYMAELSLLYREASYLATIQKVKYSLEYDHLMLGYALKNAPASEYKLTVPVIDALIKNELKGLYEEKKVYANEAKTLEKYIYLCKTYVDRISQRVSTCKSNK